MTEEASEDEDLLQFHSVTRFQRCDQIDLAGRMLLYCLLVLAMISPNPRVRMMPLLHLTQTSAEGSHSNKFLTAARGSNHTPTCEYFPVDCLGVLLERSGMGLGSPRVFYTSGVRNGLAADRAR